MMTVLATAGMVPPVVAGNLPGHEIEQPMGGLYSNGWDGGARVVEKSRSRPG